MLFGVVSVPAVVTPSSPAYCRSLRMLFGS